MTLQYATALRNAQLDAIETFGGVSAILKIRSGAPPADCQTVDSGTVLATLNLPSDYFSAAAAGAKAKLGTWEDAAADADGTAGHFRLYQTDGTTVIMQGTCGDTAEDLLLDNAVIATGQQVTITGFTITAGNA